MERQIFTWDRWDQADTATFIFYDVETTALIEGIPRGSKFACANVCYDKGVMEFIDEDNNVLHKYDMKIQLEYVKSTVAWEKKEA